MVKYWLNVRSMISEEMLQRIYKYEDLEQYRKFHPSMIVKHATSNERLIEIPTPLLDMYRMVGRRTPFTRARRLERLWNSSNQIYLKREDTLVNGSFKITSALPQAYYGAQEGMQQVITETGAGQTGVAAALAAQLNNLKCRIFMVRNSYELKNLRRLMMEMYGAEVIASPSERTKAGLAMLSKGVLDGSIASATSEVMEEIQGCCKSFNIAGSLLDFVLTYNTIIGLEVIDQLEEQSIVPDLIVGCVGGGSSFGGFALPLLDRYQDRLEKIICTESASIPTLTQGKYDYDYPDGEGEGNPLLMYSLGYDFKPPAMHASGLRYHAAAPILSYFVNQGFIEAKAYDESDAMQSAIEFSKAEGIIASPESSYTLHAIKRMCEQYENKTIVAIVTGNGQLDLASYRNFL